MTVNGLKLPASFVEFFEREGSTGWELKERVDAYGNPLGIDFEPLDSVEGMEEDTALLAEYFGPPEQYEEQITPEIRKSMEEQRAGDPGFLFDITDFSKIVQFGRSAGGAPFCFDFRDNRQEPSVILHDDRYGRWRRVAPNFDTFISLWERYRRGE
jgi:hypothetical protein